MSNGPEFNQPCLAENPIGETAIDSPNEIGEIIEETKYHPFRRYLRLARELDSDTINTERHMGVRAAEMGVVAYEMTPFDDGLRYLVLSGVYAATRSPELSTIAYAGSTMVTESAAAVAMTDLLGSKQSKKTISWINKQLDKVGIPSEAKMNKPVKAILATYLGSAFLLAIKNREEPDRTIQENLGYGLKSAAVLSGVCAVEGLALTENVDFIVKGLDNLAKPEIGFGAIIVIGGLVKARRWAMGKVSKSVDDEGSAA